MGINTMDVSPQDDKQPPRRRTLPFSLRLLFVVTTAFAVYLGMLTVRARHQRDVVDMVHDLGGSVRYLHELKDRHRANVFSRTNPAPGPGWLRKLIGQDYFLIVMLVELRDAPVTDEQLRIIAKLPYLENLSLSDTQVTNAGLAYLKKLDNLRCLALWRTPIGDEGIRHLAVHTNLQNLVLDETDISDAGLVHLSGLTNLDEWLGLVGTNVSDDGLKYLRGLKKLKTLNLRRTSVTKEGANTLKRYLPETEISVGP
jgi:hypothetical protein